VVIPAFLRPRLIGIEYEHGEYRRAAAGTRAIGAVARSQNRSASDRGSSPNPKGGAAKTTQHKGKTTTASLHREFFKQRATQLGNTSAVPIKSRNRDRKVNPRGSSDIREASQKPKSEVSKPTLQGSKPKTRTGLKLQTPDFRLCPRSYVKHAKYAAALCSA